MAKVNMKGATPVGSASLCRTCNHAHILSGYRESEMLVVCTATSSDFQVPFVVRECTGYNDRNRPDWVQMQKLAIKVAPKRESKPFGFTRGRERDAESDPRSTINPDGGADNGYFNGEARREADVQVRFLPRAQARANTVVAYSPAEFLQGGPTWHD